MPKPWIDLFTGFTIGGKFLAILAMLAYLANVAK